MRWSKISCNVVFGYLAAAVSVVALTAALLALEPYFPLGDFPIVFLLPVVLAAFLFGTGPAVFACVLGFVFFYYYFAAPAHGFVAPTSETWPALMAFAVCAALVIPTITLTRKRRYQAELLAWELSESQEDLNRAQEVAHTGSWRMDVRRNVLLWSDESHRIFGIPIGTSLTYETFLDTVHPDDREYVDTNWQAALRGESYDIEHRIVVSGTVKWVRETAGLEFDEHGELLGGFGTTQDITQRKQAEEALRESQRHAEQHAAELESFFASMGNGAAVFDAEGKPVMANDAAKRIFGVPPDVPFDEWSTAYQMQTLEGEPLPKQDYPSRRALLGEGVANTRYRLVTTWTETIISATVSPVRDAENRIVGVVAVFRDVNTEVEFERQKEQLYEREHRIAELLQEALIPQVEYDVPGWSIAVRYQPALEEAQVGGDFYDVFDLGDGKIGVLIGDVAGKGLKAAMRVAAVRHSVRSYAYLNADPAMVMALTNQAIIRDNPECDSLMTAFFAIVNLSEGTMRYTNAGHEPPILRASEGDPQEIGSYDPALGFLRDAAYSENCLSIGAGEAIVMMTDGVTEARRVGGSLFGKDGVVAWLREHPGATLDEIADGLLEAARAHAGGHLRDDAAVLIFSAEPGVLQNE